MALFPQLFVFNTRTARKWRWGVDRILRLTMAMVDVNRRFFYVPIGLLEIKTILLDGESLKIVKTRVERLSRWVVVVLRSTQVG